MDLLLELLGALLAGFALGYCLKGKLRSRRAPPALNSRENARPTTESLLLSVNHDLRQPLQALGLFITALRQKALPDDLARLAERVDASYSGFLDEFDALIDLARLAEGRTVPNAGDFVAADLWSRLADDCGILADQRGQSLRFHQGRTEVLRGDLVLLHKLLRPLVSASLRACAPGEAVLVARRLRAGRLRFEIRHGAPGMAGEQLDRLLAPFAPSSGKPPLTIRLAHRLCEAMDARLGGEVTEGRGGLLWLELPCN
ncbi:MAG TPA: HAMP domain-containing sensor histidine kinase [Candidatus Sulfotelmatobacter sp.]|jgi:signal transduction histidine kinase|nr:HAMP domain-containing sensor histidine kinase [Candidatus Sulfotelmatobacter sp.]